MTHLPQGTGLVWDAKESGMSGYRTDDELIDTFNRAVMNYASALYKNSEVVFSDVKFESAWEDRDVAWADLKQRIEDLRHSPSPEQGEQT